MDYFINSIDIKATSLTEVAFFYIKKAAFSDSLTKIKKQITNFLPTSLPEVAVLDYRLLPCKHPLVNHLHRIDGL